MQTFLPYPSFAKSLSVLDNKRLGKQRVETHQILNAILRRPKLDGTPYKGWLNHPCSIMWKDYVPALQLYYNTSLIEWVNRGFKNNMIHEIIEVDEIVYPKWFGFEDFHSSHRANLLKKEREFYSKYNWTENPQDPYVWLDDKGNWYKQIAGKKDRIYYETTEVY
jgi:hypothetical protein